MRQVFSVAKPKRFPRWKQWKRLASVLSKTERHILQISFLCLLASVGTLIGTSLLAKRIEIPARGGEYTEAFIGEPQLINPLYATTNDTDQDLVSLIYSGLMRWDAEQGIVTDLADSVEINQEATVYTFVINEQAQFHNGDPVLARDVLFTINAIQNPAYHSPLFAQFSQVSVIQEDDRKVSFVLEKPNPSFLNSLTVGILPSSAWAEILPQNAPLAALNLQPIGSGPYQFAEFSKDKKGVIRSFTLTSFDRYIHQTAYIDRLTFKFYPDAHTAVDALMNKFVEGVSVVPFDNLGITGQNRNIMVYSSPLSREVVLYFNQKINEHLQKKGVREAIALAIDKQEIVHNVLSDRNSSIVGPLLPDMVGYASDLADRQVNREQALTLITEAGLLTDTNTSTQSEASSSPTNSDEEATASETSPQPQEEKKQANAFTLTTIDSPEYLQVADAIAQQLQLIGLDITVVSVPAESLYEQVIKPRNFELLLTTLMYSTDADPYVFWHSSQGSGNGLNVIDYANTDIDALLESARSATNDADRQNAYKTFQEKLLADNPAIFLYQSSYTFAVTKKVHLTQPSRVRVPSDRFATITSWYIKTKQVFE